MPHMRVMRFLALGAVLALAAAVPGLAKSTSSVAISGPTSVKLNHSFHFKVTGAVASPANKVAVFEDNKLCSSKELTELNRGSSTELNQALVNAGHHFSLTVNLVARSLGNHYLCAYVFLRTTASNDPHKTYAHAQHKWTNHH